MLLSEPVQSSSSNDVCSVEDLVKYYSAIYPAEEIVAWLSSVGESNTNPQDYFERREFSFTLQNEIYNRYLSFKDASELVKTLIEKKPKKIDIGAVFNMPPKMHHMASHDNEIRPFIALEKELVFDIDMTDYDDVRTCCKGAKVCQICWKFIACAVSILDRTLKEDFGFSKLMWVYSGRRGIHCWVNDLKAKKLPNEFRSSIIEYLSVKRSNEMTSARLFFKYPLHPSILRAYNILEPVFKDMIINNNLFSNEKVQNRALNLIDSKEFQENLRAKLSKSKSSYENWMEIEAFVDDQIPKITNKKIKHVK